MTNMKIKLLKALKLDILGKTYTIQEVSKKQHSLFLENVTVAKANIYYVIKHGHGGFSLVKDQSITITDIEDPSYNPWGPVYERASKQKLEIHHLDHWQKVLARK